MLGHSVYEENAMYKDTEEVRQNMKLGFDRNCFTPNYASLHDGVWMKALIQNFDTRRR
jgi:hypothetical protein